MCCSLCRRRKPVIDARRASAKRARELRAEAVQPLQEDYDRLRNIVSEIRRERKVLRYKASRFCSGVHCTSSSCHHRSCFNPIRYAEVEAEEDARRAREHEAVCMSKRALVALREAQRRPLFEFLEADSSSDDGAWCCDVAGAQCIKPTLVSPEPKGVHALWVCDACDWCVCSSCYTPSQPQHPHLLDCVKLMDGETACCESYEWV